MDGPSPDLIEIKPQENPVKFYNHNDQIRSNPPREKESYGDTDLYTICVERTRALREIQGSTGIPINATGGLGLTWAIDNTPREIGKRFDAHGIAKGGDPIVLLDEILTKGIDPKRTLYSMNFTREIEASGAIGAETPKTEGGIILISDVDQKLVANGVKIVALGEEYMRTVDLMRQKYPNVLFIPWHEIPKTLAKNIEEKTGEKVALPETNRPFYPEKRSYRPEEKIINPIPIPDTSVKEGPDVW